MLRISFYVRLESCACHSQKEFTKNTYGEETSEHWHSGIVDTLLQYREDFEDNVESLTVPAEVRCSNAILSKHKCYTLDVIRAYNHRFEELFGSSKKIMPRSLFRRNDFSIDVGTQRGDLEKHLLLGNKNVLSKQPAKLQSFFFLKNCFKIQAGETLFLA